MCYPKPGPRCASHLKAQIKNLEARRETAMTAFMDGRSTEDPNQIARELEHAREEYAETRSARTAEAARIAALPDGPEKTAAQSALDAAAARYRAKVDAYKNTSAQAGRTPVTHEPPTGYAPVEVVGELGDHELSHLGIFTATLADGRVVAHNTNGPNVTCPVCRGDRAKQMNCSECAGRGKVGNIPYCPRNWDPVTEGLHLGGHDNQPGGGDARVTDQFDVVVSLYQRDGFGPDEGIPHYTHEMIDGDLDPVDHPHLHRLADKVVEAMDKGQKVLVRCQAGMNRSALVAGLALLKRGWTVDEAVTRMRQVRSEYVLFNEHFVAFLRSQEEHLRGSRSRCPQCKGHREFFGVACETCSGDGYVAA